MKEQYKIFDKVVSTTLNNFIIEECRNGDIIFSPFDPSNVEHLYAFEIALLFNQATHKKFYLDMDTFKYLVFKLKNWTLRKSFKQYTSKNKNLKLELEEILAFIKKQLNLEDDIYEQIYETYYKESTKNRSIYRWKRKK